MNQRALGNQARVDDARLDHVDVVAGRGVEAHRALVLLDVVDDQVAVKSRVLGDLAARGVHRRNDDVKALLLVALGLLLCLEHRRLGTQQRNAAAGHVTLLGRGAGRVQRVVDEVLLGLHRDLGRPAHVDDRDAAGELSVTLHELLFVVLARRAIVQSLDLLGPGEDVLLLARALDDRRVVLGHHDLLGPAELGKLHRLERSAEVLSQVRAVGENRDILEHRLATIAEARRLDRAHLEHATQTVDDQRRERLVLDFLGDDQQRLVGRGDLVEQGQQVGQVRDLLLVDQHVRVLELRLGRLGVGHEVRREVALVELHALNVIERRVGALALLDLNDAISADLGDRLGDQLGDFLVVVGRHGRDLRVVGLAAALDRHRVDRLARSLGCGVDAALELHGVRAGRDVPQALVEDRLGKHGRRGRAVARLVGGLLGDLVDHLRAHRLEGLGQADFLRHAHAVLRNVRPAVGLLDHNVPARGAHRALDRVRETINTLLHLDECVVVEHDLLGCHGSSPISLVARANRRARMCSENSACSYAGWYSVYPACSISSPAASHTQCRQRSCMYFIHPPATPAR